MENSIPQVPYKFTWDRTRYSSPWDIPEYRQGQKEWDDFFKVQGMPRAERRRRHAQARKHMLQHAKLVKR